MKLLLIGPYPPPHGGISVHVLEAKKALQAGGNEVRVLNIQRGSPHSKDYVSYNNVIGLIGLLAWHASRGWVLHVHTNGHNRRSWLLAFLCGVAGRLGPSSFLTLHSGMTPAYLQTGNGRIRSFARRVCLLYRHVIVVNEEIRDTLAGAGVAPEKMEVIPAYLNSLPSADLPAQVEAFLEEHAPVCSTVLFFRPEYGFDFLLRGLASLRAKYPRIGCIVMGDSRTANTARLAILQQDIGEGILLLGDVSHEVCLAIMARSQLFLRCTAADGDAISVREALSVGVPVVATNVGHRPADALLFPPGNLAAFVNLAESALQGPCLFRKDAASLPPTPAVAPLLAMYRHVPSEGSR